MNTIGIELIPDHLDRAANRIPADATFAIVERDTVSRVAVRCWDTQIPADVTPAEWAEKLAADEGARFVPPAAHLLIKRNYADTRWMGLNPHTTVHLKAVAA